MNAQNSIHCLIHSNQDEFENPITEENVEFFGGLTVDDVVADIKQKFDCLYFSYLVLTGRDCESGCDSTACVSMLWNPVFAAKDKWGIGEFPNGGLCNRANDPSTKY